MSEVTFNTEHFLLISNEELIAYTEPFLVSEQWTITEDEARKIEHAFPMLDKFQKVYDSGRRRSVVHGWRQTKRKACATTAGFSDTIRAYR